MKKIIVIDNYDSFTYNLVHIVEELTSHQVDVVMNDCIDMAALESYSHIILSPGPGIPDEAGQLKKVITTYGQTHLILGVCLGLQAIGEVYGATLKNLNDVFHGIQTKMYQTTVQTPIFKGIDPTFEAGRYHSWVIDKNSDLRQLHITAVDDNGDIMAIQHKEHPVYGVQFHPESIMTEHGSKMIQNFINLQL